MATTGQLQGARQDDVLECFLYPKFCFTNNPEQVTEDLLVEEISKFSQVIDKYTNDYIWHRDSLVFRPRTKQALLLDKVLEGSAVTDDRSILPHIHSTLRFDEDIGDEWFTVFLIFKLTESFEGLTARLVDGDGEFLLIEAADFLPTWATPEACQDRVFVRNGEIHVVHDRVTRGKSLLDLLRSVNDKPHISAMPDKVQAALKKRIGIYPEEIQKRKHKARAFLPEKAASILAQEPGLIAFAIRSIVHSDPLERKVCRAMRYFPPEQRTMVNVKMTRCLYAMATHCRYTGDPRTGWNFPPTNSPKYNAHLLGIKIACGLEMLVARANEERRRKGVEANGDEKPLINEQAWTTFLRRLELSGYFRGLLDGSQEREKLLSVAKEYFESQLSVSKYATSSDESEAERILKAWQNVQTNDFEMHAQDEASLSPPDSDNWLNVDAAQLEAMLGQHWNIGDKKSEPNQSVGLREKVQAFLNQSSDVDGVQFHGESCDDDAKHDQDDGGRIDFDTDVFDSTLRDILDLVVPGGDGEFDGSSEGSLGGDDDDRGGEMDKYMRLLGSEIKMEMVKEESIKQTNCKDTNLKAESENEERNLKQSIEEEAGGAGPAGNIIGGPVRRLMHLQLQSPTNCVPPDLQS